MEVDPSSQARSYYAEMIDGHPVPEQTLVDPSIPRAHNAEHSGQERRRQSPSLFQPRLVPAPRPAWPAVVLCQASEREAHLLIPQALSPEFLGLQG